MEKNMNSKKEISAVIVCGMTQSGSTLLYNMIREFYEFNNFNVLCMIAGKPTYITDGYDSTKIKNPIIQLTKQHDATSENNLENMVFINTRRDVRDCVASLSKKNPSYLGGDLIKMADENIGHFESAKTFSDYQWNYEDYKKDPIGETKKIFKFLSKFTYKSIADGVIHENKKLNPNDVYDANVAKMVHMCENIKNLNIPDSEEEDIINSHNLYKKTLMSKKHITSNNGKVGAYKQTFTKKQINLIEKECGPWLIENGYMK